MDALVLPPDAVRCLTEVLGAFKARKYRERWWHILRRLCDADTLPERFRDLGGPEMVPDDLVYRLKQRFRLFAAVFESMREHPFYRSRKNVPYLPLVLTHLLYQDIGDGWQRYAFFIKRLRTPSSRLANELRIAGVIARLASEPREGRDGVALAWRYRCMLPVADLRGFVAGRQQFLARLRRHLAANKRRK